MKLFLLIILSFASGTPPLADPGAGGYIGFSEEVVLDATGSFDPDGGEITEYLWTAPDGITLTGPSTNPTFIAPNNEDILIFSLSVTDDQGETFQPFHSEDIFISEYGEGSTGNQYLEFYNGTDSPIDLTGYEIWIIEDGSGMTWDEPDYVLLFNIDESQSNYANTEYGLGSDEEGDEMVRVDTGLLPSDGTITVIRRTNSDVYGLADENSNYVIWSSLKKLDDDHAVALVNNGVIIDQLGEDDDPGSSGFEIAGVQGYMKDNTLLRKSTVTSGNIDWASSAGTDEEDSEWVVYDKDYLDDVFNHKCRTCDGEVEFSVMAFPEAVATYLLDDLQINSSNEICSEVITLDASSSLSHTGELSYQWTEVQLNDNVFVPNEELCETLNGDWMEVGDLYSFCDQNGNDEWDSDEDENREIISIIASDQLSKKKPSFTTMSLSFCDENGDGDLDVFENQSEDECLCNAETWIEGKVLHGDFNFELIVNDGLLESEASIVNIDISSNLCSQPVVTVTHLEYISFCDKNCNNIYDENSNEDDEICADGNWLTEIPHFIDRNSGVLLYEAEAFEDQGNGVWDFYLDVDGDGVCEACGPDDDDNCVDDNCEDFFDQGNYSYDQGEDFVDVDGNGSWSEGEPYLDLGNGVYDEGEPFTDIGDGELTIYTDNDGDDICELYDGDICEDFFDINRNYTYDLDQKVILSGLNSFDLDPNGNIVDYEWEEISGYLSDSDIIYLDDLSPNGGVISFTRPDFGNAEYFVDTNGNGKCDDFEYFQDSNGNSVWDNQHGELQFTLKVNDGLSYSLVKDTITVKFTSPSPPEIPSLYARVEGTYVEGEETVGVVLTWETFPENSIDNLTGYYDFEGYKLYKSTDGGDTWGSESDKIYVNGEFKGWKPYRQWDYTRTQDLAHCIYSSDECTEENRNIDVLGYDPYSYWINVGSNSGLTHYYTDYDIINGMEYTYVLTAYDTGVWTTYLSDVTNSLEWYDSNPNQYTNVDGSGIPSLESPVIDLVEGRNYVSVVPGYYASDIDFPTIAQSSLVVSPHPENNGNGLASYQVTNLDELESVKVKFEIEADPDNRPGSFDCFEGLHTFNPTLYAFYVDHLENPISVVSHSYEGLLNSEIDSLLDLPGSYESDNMIYHPIYEIEEHEIKFIEDDEGTFSSFDHWTDFISGTRMRFLNPMREYGWTREVYVNFSDPENLIFFSMQNQSNYIVPIIGQEYTPKTEDDDVGLDLLVWADLKYNYDSSTKTFDNRPPYTYKIIFNKEAKDTAYQVLQDNLSTPYSEGCSNAPSNTLLPFTVINQYTGKKVGLRHIDRGWHNGGLMGEVPLLAPSSGCEDGDSSTDPGNYTGDCDCIWSSFEDVVFVQDSVTTESNPSVHAEATYSLELMSVAADYENVSQWREDSYDLNAQVMYGGTKWIAIEDDTHPLCPPGPMYCEIDGIDFGGSWKAVYPWSDLSTNNISLVIEPWTWFSDGDSWVADISLLGEKQEVDSDMLSEVVVTPNPYRGDSGYPDSAIRFSHLPTECEINIFTISGERVKKIRFTSSSYEEVSGQPGNQYYGSYAWDVKNAKGEPVAPGLYIYTVESLDYKHKHIGKFAIVR